MGYPLAKLLLPNLTCTVYLTQYTGYTIRCLTGQSQPIFYADAIRYQPAITAVAHDTVPEPAEAVGVCHLHLLQS